MSIRRGAAHPRSGCTCRRIACCTWGSGISKPHAREREWNAACDVFVGRFLADLKLGSPPEHMLITVDPAAATEDRLYELFCAHGLPEN
jgi:hypothetical protein